MGIASDVDAYDFYTRAVSALERIADGIGFFVEQSKAHAQAVNEPQAVQGSCPHCGAPEDKQVDASTLSQPDAKHCLICNTEYGA